MILGGLNLLCSIASANDYGFTYQGRILDKDGTPLTVETVDFLLWLDVKRTNNGNCLLFSEKQKVRMNDGTGTFSLIVGRGTRSDGGTRPLHQIFDPQLSFAETPECQGGLNKLPTDRIMLNVSFNSGRGYQTLAPLEVTFTPAAIDTVNVAGFASQRVLRVAPEPTAIPIGTTLPDGGTNYALNGTDFQNLLELLSGTSGKYLQSSGSGTLQESELPNISSPGKISGNAVTSGTIGGSTAINTTGNITTSGDFSGNRLTAKELILANPDGNQVKVVAPTTPFTPYTLSLPTSQGTSQQVLASDGANGTYWYTLPAGGGGGVSSIASGTGLLGGPITTSGTLSVDVGTAANQIVQLNSSAELPSVSGTNLTNLNASNLASGTIPNARLPASATAWADGGAGNIYFNGGNVGVGTATPSTSLDVRKTTDPSAYPNSSLHDPSSLAQYANLNLNESVPINSTMKYTSHRNSQTLVANTVDWSLLRLNGLTETIQKTHLVRLMKLEELEPASEIPVQGQF